MQFEKTYTREFFKDFKLHSSFGLVQSVLIVFEKLTRACFFQIALETILLPIHNAHWYHVLTVEPNVRFGTRNVNWLGSTLCELGSTFSCSFRQGPRSRVAGWALAHPIIFPLLVFCLCEWN